MNKIDIYRHGTDLANVDRESAARQQSLYIYFLDNPFVSRKMLVSFLMNGGRTDKEVEDGVECKFPPVQKTQAYKDIQDSYGRLSTIQTAAKQFIRYSVYEKLVEVINIARQEGDLHAEIVALSKMARYFKLDKDDVEQTDWVNYPKPNWEVSEDTELLGGTTMTNKERMERRNKLRKRLGLPVASKDADYVITNIIIPEKVEEL